MAEKTGVAIELTASDKASEEIGKAGKSMGDAFNPLNAVTAALNGNFGAMGQQLVRLAQRMKILHMSMMQFTLYAALVMALVKAVNTLREHFRAANEAANAFELGTAEANLAKMKEDAADFAKEMENARKKSEDAKKVFEAWGTGVSTHLGNFFSEDAWKERLDKTIDSLGATFAADVDAVKGFLKPSLLNDFSAIGDKASALKDELDISQYISIISSAFDDVSVPNPELYYEGFKQAVGAIIKKTGAFTDGYDKKQVETFISDAAAGIWERVRNKVLKPLVREIKRLLLRIIRQAITEVLNAILDKLPSYKDFVSQETENALRLYYSEAKARVQDVRQTVGAVADAASGGGRPRGHRPAHRHPYRSGMEGCGEGGCEGGGRFLQYGQGLWRYPETHHRHLQGHPEERHPLCQ